jgi:hypothetical protein
MGPTAFVMAEVVHRGLPARIQKNRVIVSGSS